MLTDAGRRASGDVSRAFDVLDAAFSALRAEDEGTLTITTSYTFANTWFAWRLGAFQMTNPEMAVRMLTDDAVVDFAGSEVDVGVRTGPGAWPGLASERLFRVDFPPMCSPDLLERPAYPLKTKDLLDIPPL